MDTREAVLKRLEEIYWAVPGIKSVYRNRDAVSDHDRPALVLFDSDEQADERNQGLGRGGAAANLIVMTPETYIYLGGLPANVGPALNQLRAAVIKAVLTDETLKELIGTNGAVRYEGCASTLTRGGEQRAMMGVAFSIQYPLFPSKL